MDRYCIFCMNLMGENEQECPFCGREQECSTEKFGLSPGTILKGRYYIGISLGQDEQKSVYVGADLDTHMRVKVIALRRVEGYSGAEDIKSLLDSFEENCTTYYVTEYEEMQTPLEVDVSNESRDEEPVKCLDDEAGKRYLIIKELKKFFNGKKIAKEVMLNKKEEKLKELFIKKVKWGLSTVCLFVSVLSFLMVKVNVGYISWGVSFFVLFLLNCPSVTSKFDKISIISIFFKKKILITLVALVVVCFSPSLFWGKGEYIGREKNYPNERTMMGDAALLLDESDIKGAITGLKILYQKENEKYDLYTASCEVFVRMKEGKKSYQLELVYEFIDGEWTYTGLSTIK